MARQIRSHPISFLVTIFFSLLLCKDVAAADHDGLIGSCVTSYNQTTNNQTGLIDDPYRTSLLSLFANLTTTSASTSLSFYNSTAGESPDKAYGIYLCRGDATSHLCRTCVTTITQWLSTQSNCKERVMFMDYCMIRFANYSFLGRADVRILGSEVGKFYNASISQEYNRTLEGVLQRVITDAANKSTTNSFATWEEGVDDKEKVYGLAQCTPDIDRGDCSGCLKAALSYLQPNTTSVSKFAWALLPSCQLRYDNASFYGSSSGTSNHPAAVSAFLLATWCLFFINWLLC